VHAGPIVAERETAEADSHGPLQLLHLRWQAPKGPAPHGGPSPGEGKCFCISYMVRCVIFDFFVVIYEVRISYFTYVKHGVDLDITVSRVSYTELHISNTTVVFEIYNTYMNCFHMLEGGGAVLNASYIGCISYTGLYLIHISVDNAHTY
jgi:hypothetical protein